MKLAILAAALVLAASPVLADSNGVGNGMGNDSVQSGNRGSRGGGGSGNYISREVAPGIYARTRMPDRFTSSNNYRSGSYHSGGVGDQTGHSAFSNGGK